LQVQRGHFEKIFKVHATEKQNLMKKILSLENNNYDKRTLGRRQTISVGGLSFFSEQKDTKPDFSVQSVKQPQQ
jgi:hypothetical protein